MQDTVKAMFSGRTCASPESDGLLPEVCDSSVPELIPVSIGVLLGVLLPWIGCGSIAGYLPSCSWYPITPGWGEASTVSVLLNDMEEQIMVTQMSVELGPALLP